MGIFLFSEIYIEELVNKVKEIVLEKILEGFKKDGFNFKGILFVGFMIIEDGEKVFEYNVRFGDFEI